MKYLFTTCVFFTTFLLSAQPQLSNSGTLSMTRKDYRPVISNGTTHALVLVDDTTTDAAFLYNCIRINGKYGQVWSLELDADDINELSQMSCIRYIELATRANAAHFMNDTERRVSHVDKVQAGQQNGLPKNYTGQGVIIGIVDIGFQCNNPTFFTSDGKRTRISRYWQQGNNNGTPPNGFSYGREYKDSASILQANDLDGIHATHVAGIAGGSGLSTPNLQYRGMAPDAELVFVSIKYSNDTLAGSAMGDYIVANPTILDAYKYIFDYATSVGKPAVINLSWGMHTGPHDGTSLFDKATETLVGPGKILVGANGNEGDNPMHFQHKFNHDTARTIMIENGRQFQQGESIYSDFWGSANSNFSMRIKIIDTNKNVIVQTPFISSESNQPHTLNQDADNSLFKIYMACQASNAINQKPNITVMVEHPNQRKYAIIAEIISDTSMVHGWNSGASRSWTSGSFRNRLNQIDFSSTYIGGNGDYTAGENGGTSKAVISVGAYAARTAFWNVKTKWVNDSSYTVPGRIAGFSSRGPTVDGRIKPDISAPGYDVPSSVNNDQMAIWMFDKVVLKTVFRNDTQYWMCNSGTSMASPHVTGIVALMLQANPELDPAQALDILHSTAAQDQFTGTVPNYQYGYGKVDAYAAVMRTIETSVHSYSSQPLVKMYPNPAGRELQVELPPLQQVSRIEIMSADGQVVTSVTEGLDGNSIIHIPLNSFAQGVYFLRYYGSGQVIVLKFVKD